MGGIFAGEAERPGAAGGCPCLYSERNPVNHTLIENKKATASLRIRFVLRERRFIKQENMGQGSPTEYLLQILVEYTPF
jgi:hypothetical protein